MTSSVSHFFQFCLQDIICYFLPQLLISIFSSKVHPCGDHWPNFIFSGLVFQVQVISHFIFVPHLFKISSVIGPYLGSVGVHFSFWMTVFCKIEPCLGMRILRLAVLKFFLLSCGGCHFKGLLPISVPREHERELLHLVAGRKPILTPCWKLFFWLAFHSLVIIILSGLPGGPYPLASL